MDDPIQKLLHGFRSFQRRYFAAAESQLFKRLQDGQAPKVLMIACSDSRVDPAIITAAVPGDIFVIRNIANLVPPYEPDTQHHGVSAALEFAVKQLQVEEIILMGHSDCGGIHALMTRDEKCGHANEFLDIWLDLAAPAKAAVLENLAEADEATQHRACEEASLILGLENLMTFPWINERVEQGTLTLHAWYFNLTDGQLYWYDCEDSEFKTF